LQRTWSELGPVAGFHDGYGSYGLWIICYRI